MARIFLALVILFSSFGQVFIKLGVSRIGGFGLNFVFFAFKNPFVCLGLLLYAFGAIFWLFVVRNMPLNIAYSTLSLIYPMVLLLSYLFFKEPISARQILGVALVSLGVTIIHLR